MQWMVLCACERLKCSFMVEYAMDGIVCVHALHVHYCRLRIDWEFFLLLLKKKKLATEKYTYYGNSARNTFPRGKSNFASPKFAPRDIFTGLSHRIHVGEIVRKNIIWCVGRGMGTSVLNTFENGSNGKSVQCAVVCARYCVCNWTETSLFHYCLKNQ